jgi:bifunctional non-homologous end joining protein LigD
VIEKVPSGERWLHEIKFDGYRVQVHLRDDVAKIFTRRGNDWTKRFKKVAGDARHIKAGSTPATRRPGKQRLACCALAGSPTIDTLAQR